VFVAEGVVSSTIGVHAAVDFDDEAPRGADEVRDVAADDDLAAEGDAEAAAAKLGPEELFGERRVVPEMVGPGSEFVATLGGLTTLIG